MMKSGFFSKERLGGYIITDRDLKYSYEYILLNRDILVRLDQNGIVLVQAAPPCGTVLLRREYGEKFSKWMTFFLCGGKTYCNFPVPGYERPVASKVGYLPEQAVYRHTYEALEIETHIFVPARGGDAVCSVKVKNRSGAPLFVKAFVQACPVIAPVTAGGWDKPEWYVRTSVHHDGAHALTFFSRRMDPRGNAANRRNVAMLMSGGACRAEYLLEDYTGAGDFLHPDAFGCGTWNYDFSVSLPFGRAGEGNSVAGFPFVYAAEYGFSLKEEGEREVVQVLSVLPQCGGTIPPESEVAWRKRYFEEDFRRRAALEAREEWERIFRLDRVDTGDERFDGYVNGFLPLQMQWVAILDRGWPTGMRGTRDASNDFMGMLLSDSAFSRSVLLHLFECQCRNGWFPRQVGEDRKGPHDMRGYVDGGVFVLEFLYEYVCHTKDFAVLDELRAYSDSDLSESIEAHVLRALSYYAAEENIGEDGLCKIREGDWFDGVNLAGLRGRGESVTVSCQFVMAVRYVKKLFAAAGRKADLSAAKGAAERAARGVREKAFNGAGFFSGLKNDDGAWIFSDRDPDGETRMYAVPNAFAVFSGVADRAQSALVLKNFHRLRTDIGYKLFLPPFRGGVENVGRIACGDVAPGLLGNSTVYNHGSQAFLCRACCAAGDAEMAEEVLRFLLPYDEAVHPEEETGAPPYAVVNCYQDVPPFRQRAGFSFLTGTVAMALRIVYSFLFGIRPCTEGIALRPCLTPKYDGARVTYHYNGKELNFFYCRRGFVQVKAGGTLCTETAEDVLTGERLPLIPEALISDGMEIEISY